MCGAERDGAAPAPSRPKSTVVGDWVCGCGELGFASRAVCRRCGAPRVVAPAPATADVPPTWTDGDPVVATLVEVDDPEERGAVVDAFAVTAQVEIVSVRRVQNLPLLRSHLALKETMLARGDMPKTELERPAMFHGSDADSARKIVQQGFNRSFCGKNATAYGKGVYFARDARYSCDKQYARPDADGLQHIFIVSVLVGWYCRGVANARVPAARAGDVLFDSTVDSVADPSIVVTYNDAQAYPRYLVALRSV